MLLLQYVLSSLFSHAELRGFFRLTWGRPTPDQRLIESELVAAIDGFGLRGFAGAHGRPSGALLVKIVSQRGEQARRVYHGVVFGAKKEIPD
jgi:hypothetical protein